MLEQLRRSGSASVKFSNAINHFTVTFTRTERSTPASEATRADEPTPLPPLTGRPAEIMALFTGDTELTASDVAQAAGLRPAMAKRHLARLITDGRLTATALPDSRNRAYRLPGNPCGDPANR